MNKTLIFISDKSRMFFPYIDDPNIDVENVWAPNIKNKYSFGMRVLRKLRIPVGFCFGGWKDKLEQYSRIIIFDGCYDKMLQTYLDKYAKFANKNVFCWNGSHRLQHVFDSAKYPVYSYSPMDCEKYGMKYMPTVYCKNVPVQNNELEYDCVFLGLLKDRGDMLSRLYKSMTEAGLKVLFYVVDNSNKKEYKGMPLYDKQMSYTDYLELIGKSKAILAICNDNQDGLDQRAMESIFLNKKLITTNKEIEKYDFYKKGNIYIMDKNSLVVPEVFFTTPYQTIDEDILNNYEISSWVNAF